MSELENFPNSETVGGKHKLNSSICALFESIPQREFIETGYDPTSRYSRSASNDSDVIKFGSPKLSIEEDMPAAPRFHPKSMRNLRSLSRIVISVKPSSAAATSKKLVNNSTKTSKLSNTHLHKQQLEPCCKFRLL